MKKLFIILFLGIKSLSYCQQCTGTLGQPIVNITFGSGGANPGGTLPIATNNTANTTYTYVAAAGQPPSTVQNGQYSIVNQVPVVPSGNANSWFVGSLDHTPNDNNGYMLFVNASTGAGVFYTQTIQGLCSGTTYEFAAFIANVCNATINPSFLTPNVTFSILHPTTNAVLGSISTGNIPNPTQMTWNQYALQFTMPTGINSVILRMTNANPGGNGNDLAIDDITFRPCGPTTTASFSQNSILPQQTICKGNNTTVYGTIGTGLNTPSYQWQNSTDGINWSDITGATSINYNINGFMASSVFYRLLSAESGNINTPNCRYISNNITLFSQECCPDTNCYWSLNGNTLVNQNKFIGTKNNFDFNVRTNNVQRMTVDKNGNIGVSTPTPLAKMHIEGGKLVVNSTSGSYGIMQLTNPNVDEATLVMASGVSAGYGGVLTSSKSDYIWALGPGSYGTTPDRFNIGNNGYGGAIFTVLAPTGNVGIGTTAPQKPLHVAGETRIAALPALAFTRIVTSNANGDLQSLALPTSNPTTSYLRGDGTWATMPASSGNATNTCTAIGRVPRLTAANTYGCSQIFDDGTSVGINTTTGFAYTSLSGARLGSTVPATSGTVRLDVNGVQRSIASIVTSDGKLKTDIKSIENALEIIQSLNGKTYNWTEEIQKETGVDNGRHIGYIAQEIEKTLPEIVIADENGRLGVNYTELIPVLSEALKELNAKVEKQNNAVIENDALKAKLSTLEEKLALLEKSITTLCESGCAGLEKKADVNMLYQSIPNPTDDVALINYYLASEGSTAEIKLYMQEGKELQSFSLQPTKGNGSVKVSLGNLTDGTYLYSLIVDGKVIDTKRLQILK